MRPVRGMQSAEEKAAVAERTVFVRNLHVDATPEELTELMGRFGKVTACRIVKDRATGKPAGKAFVEFEDKRAAGQACAASDRAERGEARSLALHRRALKLHVMLQPKDVQQLARDNARKQDYQKDRRNLYLSKEGHISENDPATEGMSKEDLELRQTVFQERTEKLKRPTNSLNPRRLLLRNLPLSLDVKGLKELCLGAVCARATKASPAVIHAKVLTTEKGGRSRGRGYVEFSQPDHALTCLRHLNNNPTTFTRDRRPVVEFAVDDANRRQQREKRLSETGAHSPANPKRRGSKVEGRATVNTKDTEGTGKRKRKDRSGEAQGEEGRPKAPRERKGRSERLDRKRPREDKKGLGRDKAPDLAAGSKATGERKKVKKMNGRGAPEQASATPKRAAAPPKKAGEKLPGRDAGSRRDRGKGEEKFDDLVSSYRKKFDNEGAGLKGWF